jgi:hypothetical protein
MENGDSAKAFAKCIGCISKFSQGPFYNVRITRVLFKKEDL